MSVVYCSCAVPQPQLAEGIAYCEECGERVRSPELAAIMRGVASVINKVDGLAERMDAKGGDSPERDLKLIGPAEVARLTGQPRSWVYDNADELGALRFGSGPKARILFNRQVLSERLSPCSSDRRTRSPESPNGKPKRRSPRKPRLGTTTDLLPVRGRKPA